MRSGLLGERSAGEGVGWVLCGSSHSGIVLVGLVSIVGSFPPSQRISLEPLKRFRRALCMSLTAPLCLRVCIDLIMGSVHPLRVCVTVPRASVFFALCTSGSRARVVVCESAL
jgi:hypothetical protein